MEKITEKFRFKKTSLFAMSLLLVVGFWGGAVSAEDEIDLEYPVGTNLNGKDIFNAKNIYPGWEDSKTIRVENNDENEDADIYFTFDVESSVDNDDKNLAEKLKLYVVRVEDGSYRIGGEGDRYTLEEADDEELFVDRLSATKGKEYRIKIKFDKDAGNEYQGIEAKFDIDFQIESESAATETVAEVLDGEGRVVTGDQPADEAGTTEQEQTTVQGDQEGGDGDVNVEGIKNICQWWPLWVWILALIVFVIVFLFSLFYKFKEQKEGQYPRRFSPAILVVAGLAFWYFFDKCDERRWFAITLAIGALVIYLIYLYIFKKSVSSNLKIDEEKFEIKTEEASEK